jgi:hypothetical protein
MANKPALRAPRHGTDCRAARRVASQLLTGGNDWPIDLEKGAKNINRKNHSRFSIRLLEHPHFCLASNIIILTKTEKTG